MWLIQAAGVLTSCWIARHCGKAGSEKWASTRSVAILDYIEWLGFSDLPRKETILLSRSNFFTYRNIENTVGLRQGCIKSLFGRHLCLFQAVSMKISGENSADKLVDSLLGKAKPPTNLPALKYGRDMEPIAVEEFVKYFKKHHKDVRYRECGIFIDKTKQYLGASPDLLIECSCCGKAVVEIKNPFNIASEIPSAAAASVLCTGPG